MGDPLNKLRELGTQRTTLRANLHETNQQIAQLAAKLIKDGHPKNQIAEAAQVSRPGLDQMLSKLDHD